jgi:glucose/arabinose dehydrogenase
VVQEGLDYGWPACHSASILDPEFGFEGACRGIEPPIVDLQAHSAPLGLVFYAGDTFPEDYRGDLFVAYHGSWNRSVPTGYKVVRVAFGEAGSTPQVLDFATGWLMPNGGQVTGRPTGVAVGPDGALYVSDDKGGFIYRIQYVGG